jgi:hypothetical protein
MKTSTCEHKTMNRADASRVVELKKTIPPALVRFGADGIVVLLRSAPRPASASRALLARLAHFFRGVALKFSTSQALALKIVRGVERLRPLAGAEKPHLACRKAFLGRSASGKCFATARQALDQRSSYRWCAAFVPVVPSVEV